METLRVAQNGTYRQEADPAISRRLSDLSDSHCLGRTKRLNGRDMWRYREGVLRNCYGPLSLLPVHGITQDEDEFKALPDERGIYGLWGAWDRRLLHLRPPHYSAPSRARASAFASR